MSLLEEEEDVEIMGSDVHEIRCACVDPETGGRVEFLVPKRTLSHMKTVEAAIKEGSFDKDQVMPIHQTTPQAFQTILEFLNLHGNSDAGFTKDITHEAARFLKERFDHDFPTGIHLLASVNFLNNPELYEALVTYFARSIIVLTPDEIANCMHVAPLTPEEIEAAYEEQALVLAPYNEFLSKLK